LALNTSQASLAAAPLFERRWTFLRGISNLADLPPEGPPEIAFAGRSNVGKSSLINAVLKQQGLARTSNTPGRTQELNIFVPETEALAQLAPPIAVIDMPGYGYAEAPKKLVAGWTKLVFDYLRGRVTLKRVFVLIDSRHGLKANDLEVLDMLDKAAVSYQIVLTKTDKIKPPAVETLLAATAEAIRKRAAAFPVIHATSSEKGDGIAALQHEIAALADQLV
jgi:GTP-binding protein